MSDSKNNKSTKYQVGPFPTKYLRMNSPPEVEHTLEKFSRD